MLNSVRLMATVLAIGVLAGACAETMDSEQAPEPREITIRVTNNNWADMTVYAVRGGMRVRLGTVTSLTTATFDLPRAAAAPGADLRLLADPIGARTAFLSAPILVGPGQRIVWRLQNMLSLSTFSVW